jgi:hypothetical protein
LDTSDIAAALAERVERMVDEQCAAIRIEAEKVITAFRQRAALLVGPTKPTPPPPPPEPIQDRMPDRVDDEELPPRLAARVLEI